MKTFLTTFKCRLALVLVAMLCSLNASAIDWTPINLGQAVDVNAGEQHFAVTADKDGIMTLQAAPGGNWIGSFEIYSDAEANNVLPVEDSGSSVKFAVSAAKTYYITFWNYDGVTGSLIASIEEAGANNYPQLQLDEPFIVKNFDFNTVWAFKAPKSGIATISGATENEYYGPCLEVYADDTFTGGNISSFQYGPARDEFAVEEGHTYYIKGNNWSGQDIRAKITMPTGDAGFAFTGAEPQDGGMYSAASNETVFLRFTTANVSFDRGEITTPAGRLCGVYKYEDWNQLVQEGIVSVTQSGTSGVENWNGNLFGRSENGIAISFTTHTGSGFYNPVLRAYEEGNLDVNAPITLTLHGVVSTLTGELLNGDGELSLTWYFAGAPTTLVSANMPKVVKSWFNEGDPEAIATFTFSRDIRSAAAALEMGEGEGAEDLYFEEIAADKISIEGATVKVDLSGVMRTKEMMNMKYDWPEFRLRLHSVVDVDGNATYSEDLGSASSYQYTIPYENITKTIAYEFTPESGTELSADVKSIEIAFNNSDLITWSGVAYTYYTLVEEEEIDNEGNPVTIQVNKASELVFAKDDLEVDEFDGWTVITVPVPAGLAEARNIRLEVNVTNSVDGMEHPIVAYYNTSVLYELELEQYIAPENNAEVNILNELYITLGSTYAINQNFPNPVILQGKTNSVSTTGRIVPDGRTNAKIVLAEPITAEGAYTLTIAEGAIGDPIYGDSNYQSGTANKEAMLNYYVTGRWNGLDFIVTPEDGETLPRLESFTISAITLNSIAPSWNVEKQAYVETVVEEGEPVKYMGDFVSPQAAGNEIVFQLLQPITAPGKYRLVVPAGAIANGATGDPIESEFTATYTVEPSAAPEKPAVTPAEGTYDEISQIVFDFGQPVEIIEDEWGWTEAPYFTYMGNWGWEEMVSGMVTAGEKDSEVVFTLYEPIVKNLELTLHLSAGLVRFADGTTNGEATYSYIVTGNNSVSLNVVSTTPEQWSYVDELDEIVVTFDKAVTFDEWNAEVTLFNDFWTKWATGTLQTTDDPTTVKVVFDETVRNFGSSSISFYGGTFYVDGKPYDETINLYFTIGEDSGNGGDVEVSFEITPAPFSTVESLKYFELTYDGCNGVYNEEPIVLYDAYDNVVASLPAYSLSGIAEDGTWFWEQGKYSTVSITLPEAVTTEGIYTLYIPAICETNAGEVTKDLYFTYTVEKGVSDVIGNTSLEKIDSIFSIDGRKLDRISRPGLYIINGRRVLVK